MEHSVKYCKLMHRRFIYIDTLAASNYLLLFSMCFKNKKAKKKKRYKDKPSLS